MSSRTYNLTRFDGHNLAAGADVVAEEVPVAFVYNGVSHAVMMASPADLADFATGFSLSEGIMDTPADLLDLEIQREGKGISLNMRLSARCFARLQGARRSLTGRTGCGLCGVESLQQALRQPQPVTGSTAVEARVIAQLPELLVDHQAVRAETGSVHAAAWVDVDGAFIVVREDVGRHNALDKVLGAMSTGPARPGLVLVSSRASYEMVSKTAARGLTMLVAVSAPTSLAIELARDVGLTLVAFARHGAFKVYSHPQRVCNVETVDPGAQS